MYMSVVCRVLLLVQCLLELILGTVEGFLALLFGLLQGLLRLRLRLVHGLLGGIHHASSSLLALLPAVLLLSIHHSLDILPFMRHVFTSVFPGDFSILHGGCCTSRGFRRDTDHRVFSRRGFDC